MQLVEKPFNSEVMYDGKIIKVHRDEVRLPDGNDGVREVVEHSGGVCVLPLTDSDEVILVKQFRYPHREVLLEIPAGKLEPGEEPLSCGKRELLEETGCTAERYDYLGQIYPTPAYCSEVIHMYLGRGLKESRRSPAENAESDNNTNGYPDHDEFLEVVKMPFDKVIDMVFRNEIPDAKTALAMLKAKILLNN